ncbi:MAG: D-alanyl-D-alanine carboxypeptidase family protein [Solirubrobacterales bacterium]
MRTVAVLALAALALLPAGATRAAAEAKDRARQAPPRIEARAWSVADGRTGEPLSGHAAARRLPIASTTKLMTAYLALQDLPLSRRVRAVPYQAIPGESLLGLSPGEAISVRDLLYGLVLRSGNDAAATLAVAAAGSQARFVRQMNLRAAALGMADTHYSNPIGLDAPGNYSSARDLITLTRRLLRIPAFARIADSRTALLASLRPPERIYTRNTLLLDEPWATGVKTGHTLGAGYVLVGSGRRRGVELISAVLGAPSEATRDSDTVRLLDYGFERYVRRAPLRRGRAVVSPSIRYAGGELPLVPARTVVVGVRRGQRVSLEIRAPGEVEGPIARGARLGAATVLVDGRPAATATLVASRDIPKAGLFDRARSFVSERWIALALAACAILVAAVLLVRWLRRREGIG